jgi:ribonuclease Z
VKLVLLGTTGFLPTDTAQTACYLLPEVGILLDAGSGLYRLPEYLQTPELDIYLSHAHADHTSGLDYLFASFLKWDLRTSSQSLSEENIEGFAQRANVALRKTRIHADKATLAVVQPKYCEIPFEWCALQTQESLPSDGLLTHFILENNTIGYRLDWPGHSLAYITDTIARPTASYVEKISGVDVLLHDCYGPDDLSGLMEKIGHSHLTAVAQVAARAQVKRLILIHHSPLEELNYNADLERARQVFPLIEVGHDGMEIDF